ncbi:MAG: serine/threonine-protein kinase [Kofleriaceae bacterium]
MAGIPAGAGALLGKRLGKYEILALLALGGTAEIYLARIGGAAGFEKYVVVKCLHDHLVDDPEFVRMFLDEARLAALLDHSNIVQTFELGEHEGRYYMVMEFLAGLSLAMVVRRAAERLPGGRLPVPLVLNACAQACAGLQYAHERNNGGRVLNIVHRDMSPQNLVVTFEGVVKVVDFGIAKAEMRETRTRSGTIKGKFAYMSPEQCVANNVDRRTDVFALGVILHELLTGRRLFKRPSPYDTYQAVIECNVVPPSQLNHELDPSLDPIVLRALAKDKDQRYETAELFGDALMGYLHHRGKGSGPGELARFFDTHFTQELEEHSSRMRDLISGREVPVDGGASWDEELDAAVEAARDADLRAEQAEALDAGPAASASGEILAASARPLSAGQGVHEDDELAADRTRIEENPLDLAPTVRPGTLDIADLGDWVGDLSSSPDAAPHVEAAAQGASGVSVDLHAAAPTVLAEPIAASGPAGDLEHATVVAPGITPTPPPLPRAGAGGAAGVEAPTLLAAPVTPERPPLPPHFAPPSAATPPPPPSAVARPAGPDASAPVPAFVPSAGGSGAAAAAPPPGTPPLDPGSPGAGAPPGPRGAGPGPAPGGPGLGPDAGYPPRPGGPGPDVNGRPGGFPPGPGGPPHLMSPVGPGMPNVNWDEMAARRAKSLPWWGLALMFVAVVGFALGLTFIVAQAF